MTNKSNKSNIVFGLCISTIISAIFFQFIIYNSISSSVDKQSQEISELKEEIQSLYLLSVIQSRQIETLFNVELRRTNPAIQEKLEKVQQRYQELDSIEERE
tara:strand:+ start:1638 stop:1943 length:306 start_codon:yes stop_codon:yes gene_type:complete